ncbi:MAG: LysR family transcriptional regulator [Solirubrobacterales bacterium]|nr:LysR family transcriptional regulator [Solirubrobacterales bacterium]
MDLRQLRYLVALADERHFTRAAAQLHVAQPALSQQIRRLEDEVGLPLVDRTTRRVALTEAGELLVERARRALGEVEAARAELADLAGVRAGRVVVGAMQSLGPLDLSELLAAFHADHPAVDLVVQEEVSDVLLDMVRRDAVELAFVSLVGGAPQDGLEVQPLLTESLVVLLAPGHPLARRARLRMADLAQERFITFREGAGLRRVTIAAAQEAGFEPQIAFETNEVLRARALASRGLGVTVVPESDAGPHGPPVAAIPLHRPALARDVTLVWRRDRRLSPAGRAFLALARTADRTGAPA